MIEPRGFNLRDAAAYCGLKPSRLNTISRPGGGGPVPVRIGRRQRVWLRETLDEWLDHLAGKGPSSGVINEWLK